MTRVSPPFVIPSNARDLLFLFRDSCFVTRALWHRHSCLCSWGALECGSLHPLLRCNPSRSSVSWGATVSTVKAAASRRTPKCRRADRKNACFCVCVEMIGLTRNQLVCVKMIGLTREHQTHKENCPTDLAGDLPGDSPLGLSRSSPLPSSVISEARFPQVGIAGRVVCVRRFLEGRLIRSSQSPHT